MYCLWIGGKKVYSLEQLNDNFDLDSIEVYYYGGGLVRWLRLYGEADIADKIEKIDASSDVSEQLAEIFGQPKPIKKAQSDTAADLAAPKRYKDKSTSFTFEGQKPKSSFHINDELSSFSSELIPLSSFEMTSFGGSSFTQALFYTGSGAILAASFSLEVSSFWTTSFNFLSTSFMSSSFHQYEYEFEAGGSFNFGSFSLALGSFTSYVSSFNTADLTVDSPAPKACSKDCYISDGINNKTEAPTLSPQEKILQNFSACPLNRFGYGLHLI